MEGKGFSLSLRQEVEPTTIHGSYHRKVASVVGADPASSVPFGQYHQGCVGYPNLLIGITGHHLRTRDHVGWCQDRQFEATAGERLNDTNLVFPSEVLADEVVEFGEYEGANDDAVALSLKQLCAFVMSLACL